MSSLVQGVKLGLVRPLLNMLKGSGFESSVFPEIFLLPGGVLFRMSLAVYVGEYISYDVFILESIHLYAYY